MHLQATPPGIAIIAPSGCAPETANLDAALQLLRELGFVVHNYYQHTARHLRFGASDAERVAQLHAAARNPDVKLVMALRGSYGLSRILHQIDWQLLAQSGKSFVGYSDFTALNLALLAQTGAISFTGPMLTDDFTREDFQGNADSQFMFDSFLQCMQGPQHTVRLESQLGLPADADITPISGRLWGGNLAMIVHLLGTPYMPQVENGILFVEDISEHPYRVERMLLQLLHAGILRQQRALVLGDFSGYRLSPYDNGFDFAAMLDFIRSQVNIPIFTGLAYGHIRRRVTLPIGASAQLGRDADGLYLRCFDYPVLK